MPTVAQHLLTTFGKWGISHAFGVPGRENKEILYNECPDVKFVTARVEFNAGLMAEFTARVTRQPQVAFCTMGPGATNMVTAAASAMLNHAPLLIVSAQVERDDRSYNVTHQCVDQRRIFEPVTKWSAELEEADQLPGHLQRALSVMLAEPLGPAHISIPADLQGQEISPQAAEEPNQSPSLQTVWPDTRLDVNQLAAVHAHLARAQRPLCLVGHEAVRAGAQEMIRALCEGWNMPLLSAANAKGMMPFEHPLNLGAASCYMEGILRYPTALKDIFSDVDVIVNVGYQYVDDILPKMWQHGRSKEIVHLSAFQADATSAKYQPTCELIGRVDLTLAALLGLQAHPKALPDFSVLREKLANAYASRSRYGTLSPEEAIRVIDNHLGDGYFITDIGYYRHHATLLNRPGSTERFFTDSGLSTFGCGLPAAAAAQLMDRKRPVFLLCGDGGFQSGSCDLETLVRHQLPVVIVVLNNNAFGLIQRYQGRARTGKNPDILAFHRVDFTYLAQAYGIPSGYAADAETLDKLLADRDRTLPLLVEAPLAYDPDDHFTESF